MAWNIGGGSRVAPTPPNRPGLARGQSVPTNSGPFTRGGTLARSIALAVTPPVKTGTIATATSTLVNPNVKSPTPPVSVSSTWTSPLSDPTQGMRRLPGVKESPAAKHARLYPVIKEPIVKARPYEPAFGWMKGSTPPATSVAMGEAFGNPNDRNRFDRDLRATLRTNIRQANTDALSFSGAQNTNRLHGIDYIRGKKTRPNVPSGTAGSSWLVTKNPTMTGKMSGTVTTPISIQERLKSIAVGSQKMIPNLLKPAAKTPVTFAARLTNAVAAPVSTAKANIMNNFFGR